MMRLLAISPLILFHLSIVIALVVPNLHPKESEIETAIEPAAVNALPDSIDISKGDTEENAFGKRSEDCLPYEYSDSSEVFNKKDFSYIDETNGDYRLKRSIPFETEDLGSISEEYLWDDYSSKKVEEYSGKEESLLERGMEYIPLGNNDFGHFDKRDDDFFEGIDADYLFWKRGIREESDGLINVCLWKFKEDSGCIKKSKESPQRRDPNNYPEADDQNHFRYRRDGDNPNADDEKYWTFKRGKDKHDEPDYGYIVERDENYFDYEEEEYLRKRYESYSYGNDDKYLSRRESYLLSNRAEDVSDLEGGDQHSEMENDHSQQMHEAEECNAEYFDEIDDYLCEIDKVSKTPVHPISKTRNDLPAINNYLCETTEGSPVVADVVMIANKFIYEKGMLRCRARNMFGSSCTRLGGFGGAQIGICSIHGGWFVFCDNVGKYVLELNKRCKREINGIWRVGGTIFHEDGKGSLIVY